MSYLENMRTAISYLRFSSLPQSKGDTIRRQLEMSAEFARENNLRIDTTFRDDGVSGFDKKNQTEGALFRLLERIKKGEIKPGTVLLVEALDRLSRSELTDQLELFLGILRAGIEIVTLTDKRRFTKKSVDENPNDLMLSLVYMIRGHDESAMKSKRLKAAWETKRKKILEKILTKRMPEWLEVADDGKSFKPVPERAAIVRRMFQLASKGIGKRLVAKELNDKGIKPWGKGRWWHDSYVQKILSNRAVLGEFQMHKMENGKRVPVGDPLPNYFPCIVDKAQFFKITRHKRHSGPVGKSVSNLFSGRIFDGPSGLPMHFIRKGTRKRGWKNWNYLVNSGNVIGQAKNSWNYKIFEEYVLHHLEEVDWQQLLPKTDSGDVHAEQKIGLEAKLDGVQRSLARLMKLARDSDSPPKNIIADISRLETEEANFKQQLIILDRKDSERDALQKRIVQGADDFKKLIRAGDRDSRLRLREEIRARVTRIDLFSDVQTTSAVNKDLAMMIDLMEQSGREIIPSPLNWPRYKITFSNGVERWSICRYNMTGRKKLLPQRDLTGEIIYLWPVAPITEFNLLKRAKKQEQQATRRKAKERKRGGKGKI